jgi:hypothetical protein
VTSRVTSESTNRSTVAKASRPGVVYINNKMAAHNQYRNIDARAHINVQMKSAEIRAH